MSTKLPRDGNGELPELARLLDAAWLCAHGFGVLPAAPPISQPNPVVDPVEPDSKSGTSGTEKDNPAKASPSPDKPKPSPQSEEDVAEIKADAGAGGQANSRRIAIPAARAITDGRTLVRALKPLRRRVPDPQRQTLDEARTVDYYAQTRLSMPIFTRASQRWLNLVLLVDNATSMRLWSEVVSEFHALLVQLAGFADVRIWQLDTSLPGKATLHAKASGPERPWKELLCANGRTLILVVSDSMAPAWDGGGMAALVDAIGKCAPVALAQVLPSRWWRRTGLDPAGGVQNVYVGAALPGARNSQLQRQWMRAPRGLVAPKGVPLPVFGLKPEAMNRWAELVGKGRRCDTPALILPLRPDDTGGVDTTASLDMPAPLQLLENFRVLASPRAFELTRLFAASVLQLPVMRLVQRTLAPDTGHEELAEFFLSGLIEELDQDQGAEARAPNRAIFEFKPGIRDVLIDASVQANSVRVLDVLSRHIGERMGQALSFDAVIKDPENFAKNTARAGLQSFAELQAHVLARFGGGYAASAKRIRQGLAQNRSAPPVVSAVTPPGNIFSFSGLTPFSHTLTFHATAPCELDCVTSGNGFVVTPSRLKLDVHTPAVFTLSRLVTTAGSFHGKLTFTPVAPATGGPFVYEPVIVATDHQRFPLSGKRLLWADDNFGEKKSELAKLKEMGVADIYSVDSTSEAHEALSLANFDAVITDLGRKGEKLAGLTLVNELDTNFPSIPIAIYSNSAERFESQALQFGAVACTSDFQGILEAFSIHFLTNISAREKRIWPRAALERLRVGLNFSFNSSELDALAFRDVLEAFKSKDQNERLRLVENVLQLLVGKKLINARVLSTPDHVGTSLRDGYNVGKPNSQGQVCIAKIRAGTELLLSARQNEWVNDALSAVVVAGRRSFLAWAKDIGLIEMPSAERVRLMVNLFFFVHRNYPARPAYLLRSMLNVTLARWSAHCSENQVARPNLDVENDSNDAVIRAMIEIEDGSSDRAEGDLTHWPTRIPLVVSSICLWLSTKGALSEKLIEDVSVGLSILDRLIDEKTVVAAIAAMDTDNRFWSITDLPRAWIAFDLMRAKIETERLELLGMALETFGFGSITTNYWFSPNISEETELRALGIPDAIPWALDVESHADESSGADHVACATDHDAQIITHNFATHVITNKRDTLGSYLDFSGPTLDIFLNGLLKIFQTIETKLAGSNLLAPIFIHTNVKVALNSGLAKNLNKHRVFQLDGPAQSDTTNLNSKLVDFVFESPNAVGVSPESIASLVLTNSINDPNFRTLKARAHNPTFALTQTSFDSDIAEFARALRDMVEAKTYPADPKDTHKNKFGRYPSRNRRTLSTTVKPLPFLDGEYLVTLQVHGEDHWPLTGEVIFHLDQSFAKYGPLPPTVTETASGNSASIQLTAWGAFTVGVLCDEGFTNLELDLSVSPDAPPEFLAVEVAPSARQLRMSDLMVAIDRKNLKFLLRAKPDVMATLATCDPELIATVDRVVKELVEQKFQSKVSGAISDDILLIQLNSQSFERTEALINAEKLQQFLAPSGESDERNRMRPFEPTNIRIAFSCAGEHALVERIAELVEEKLGVGSVFYDEWLLGNDTSERRRNVFLRDAELVVLCLSADSGFKPWTTMEYDAIVSRRSRFRESNPNAIYHEELLLRVGEGDRYGFPDKPIIYDARSMAPAEILKIIVSKLELANKQPPQLSNYVFISHAAHDREMARQIERGLAVKGIETFMFTGDVQSGEQIMEMINSALARSTHFLCLLTPTSIGREFVRRELNAATHRQIQGKLKMILVAADGFNAKEHLHDQFPVLANFPLLDFLTADVTVPLLAAEILREPSESKLIEADSAAIEANQHGLSKAAFAIVSHFCRDSDDGIESRTVASEFNELRRLTDSDQAEMEAAIVELKGDVRDLRGSARRALSACPTLFARYDHLFHDWWPELDAVQIGTYLVGEPNIYHSVEQLSQKLSLPPRRVNPAAQWLMMHNLCFSADAATASNFLKKRLRANGSTREFLREYGERV